MNEKIYLLQAEIKADLERISETYTELESLKQQPPGNYKVVWDGRTDSGQQIASGVYLIRLESREKVLSQKVVFLK